MPNFCDDEFVDVGTSTAALSSISDTDDNEREVKTALHVSFVIRLDGKIFQPEGRFVYSWFLSIAFRTASLLEPGFSDSSSLSATLSVHALWKEKTLFKESVNLGLLEKRHPSFF